MLIENKSMIFLSNELMNPELQREMKLPLEFISFAFVEEMRMYRHLRTMNTFIVPNDVKRTWGNTVAYGGLFILNDFDYFIRTLDAYHMCSLSTLKRNHLYDVHHRVPVQATPIYFSTIEDFTRHKYTEQEPTTVNAYIGNLTNPNITQRLREIRHRGRVTSGVDVPHFTSLLREVNQ